MTSQKRWDRTYAKANPFQLPQTIKRTVRTCSDMHEHNGNGSLQYLWAYLAEDGLKDIAGGESRLNLEEWLGVIDETASLGVTCVILSIGAPLAEYPEAIEICRWAQDAHQMMVGLHLYGVSITSPDVALIATLDPGRTHLFIDPDCMETAKPIRDKGFQVYDAIGQDQDMVEPECRLPEEMACVGAGGTMYTCGLVLGDEEFLLGDFYARKLKSVMKDESLPHTVPAGLPKVRNKCNGCPPLMLQRMEEAQPTQ